MADIPMEFCNGNIRMVLVLTLTCFPVAKCWNRPNEKGTYLLNLST